MSDPKIGITNLPTPGAPRSPAATPSPASSAGPSAAVLPARPSAAAPRSVPPEKSSRGIDIIFKVGFAVALIVAGYFIFRTVSMQPMLVQAKSDNSQLRTQLDEAKAESVTARANANELTESVSQLQKQHKQLQTETASAKASAEKAAGEIATLQAQLRQAQNETAMAKANAQKASSELAKLQARLQPTPAAPLPAPAVATPAPPAPAPAVTAAPRSKPMPLSVSFRKAEVGDGNAVLLQNTSDTALSVTATFSNPSATASKTYRLVLNSGAVKELGSLGAWKLSSGDRVQVESSGYDPIVRTTP